MTVSSACAISREENHHKMLIPGVRPGNQVVQDALPRVCLCIWGIPGQENTENLQTPTLVPRLLYDFGS